MNSTHTDGGSFVHGDVNTQGNFIGRDLVQIIHEQVEQQPITAKSIRDAVVDFVGREIEVKSIITEIHASIAVKKPFVFGIRGMGGVGKTELALFIIQNAKQIFSDGQILLDFKGLTNPVSPDDALRTLIRAFNPNLVLPNDLSMLREIYYEILREKKVLILADNVKDASQVRSLVPPPNCALIITSRHRFLLPGMKSIDLSTLSETSASQLLLIICPRIGEIHAEISKECGYLPLALRVTGSVLANDDTLPIQNYLSQLKDERRKLALLKDLDDPDLDVYTSLQLSYSNLSSNAQDIFVKLSVFPASFDLAAVQAITEVENVETILGLLRRQSLVSWNEIIGHYDLHDLVRAFGKMMLINPNLVTIRHARYFLNLGAQLTNKYLESGNAALEALEEFDLILPHLFVSWDRMQDLRTSESLEFLKTYPQVLAQLLNLRATPTMRLKYLELALEIAKAQDDKRYSLNHQANLGTAYYSVGRLFDAIKMHKETLESIRALKAHRAECNVLTNLGAAYLALGEVGEAVENYELALSIATSLELHVDTASILTSLGLAKAEQDELADALKFQEDALTLLRVGENPQVETAILSNLGLLYLKLGQKSKAIDFCMKAVEIAKRVKDLYGEMQAMDNFGQIYQSLGQVEESESCYRTALTLSQMLGDKASESSVSWNYGILQLKQNKEVEARELMRKRIEYCIQTKHTQLQSLTDYFNQVFK